MTGRELDVPGQHPDLAGHVTVPDVLLQPHSAPLGIAFYDGSQFPVEYRGDVFVTSRGSWNREKRTGYKVVRLRFANGKPTGEYQDFLTGFVVSDQAVWARPVGVAVAHDGAGAGLCASAAAASTRVHAGRSMVDAHPARTGTMESMPPKTDGQLESSLYVDDVVRPLAPPAAPDAPSTGSGADTHAGRSRFLCLWSGGDGGRESGGLRVL